MKQLKLEDFMTYRPLSRLTFAPGGARAAFVLTAVNEEKDGYDQSIWLYEDGGVRRLTGLGKEGRFVWEDATHLLFPACRTAAEKKRAEAHDSFTAFYRLDIGGGEALPAFTLPFTAVDLKPLGDGRWAVTGSIDARQPDAYLLDRDGREALAKQYREDADYIVADEIPFWFNGAGDIAKKRTALFVFDPASGKTARLTAPTFDVGSFAVADGKIWFTGEDYTQKPSENAELFCWNGRRVARAWRNTRGWGLYGVVSAFGGIAALATDRKRFGPHQNPFFYLYDAEKKALTLLAENDEGIGAGVIGDCGYGATRDVLGRPDALYFLRTIGGCSQLCALSRAGALTVLLAQEGAVVDFDVSDAGEALVNGMYDMRLQDLYRVEQGRAVRLTAFNEEALAGKYIAPCEPLSIESRGWRIDGWVLRPRDFDPKKRYPAVLDIHGGPKMAYGPIFFHEMQVWANRGYFVLFCNPYGGEGRGNAFADMRGKYGTIDYDNLMDFTDAVLARHSQIDPARVAVTGGSYGGFMTNWIIGHTDRFACAATQRSISNWTSFVGTSDIGPTFGLDQTGADSATDVKRMWDCSPLKFADRFRTPTLIIHSDEDYRCPLEQGLQLFAALCGRGVPARIVRFRGENHELSRGGKPQHRLRRLREITDWFDKYTK